MLPIIFYFSYFESVQRYFIASPCIKLINGVISCIRLIGEMMCNLLTDYVDIAHIKSLEMCVFCSLFSFHSFFFSCFFFIYHIYFFHFLSFLFVFVSMWNKDSHSIVCFLCFFSKTISQKNVSENRAQRCSNMYSLLRLFN